MPHVALNFWTNPNSIFWTTVWGVFKVLKSPFTLGFIYAIGANVILLACFEATTGICMSLIFLKWVILVPVIVNNWLHIFVTAIFDVKFYNIWLILFSTILTGCIFGLAFLGMSRVYILVRNILKKTHTKERIVWNKYVIWMIGPLLGLLIGWLPFFAMPGYYFAEWTCGGDIMLAACNNTYLFIMTLCTNIVLYSVVWFLILGIARFARKEK
jgi:hypothetical protein